MERGSNDDNINKGEGKENAAKWKKSDSRETG